jgi:outer membrane protein assembly factor BamA
MAVSTEQLAEDMLKMVTEYEGKKNLKAGDLTKAMIAKYGDEVSKQDCKAAIRELMDSARTVYSYFGGSYITLPKNEGAAPV